MEEKKKKPRDAAGEGLLATVPSPFVPCLFITNNPEFQNGARGLPGIVTHIQVPFLIVITQPSDYFLTSFDFRALGRARFASEGGGKRGHRAY